MLRSCITLCHIMAANISNLCQNPLIKKQFITVTLYSKVWLLLDLDTMCQVFVCTIYVISIIFHHIWKVACIKNTNSFAFEKQRMGREMGARAKCKRSKVTRVTQIIRKYRQLDHSIHCITYKIQLKKHEKYWLKIKKSFFYGDNHNLYSSVTMSFVFFLIGS